MKILPSVCSICEMSVVLIPSQVALFSQSPDSEQMRAPLVLLALYPTMHCRVKMVPVRVGTEMSRTSEKLTVRFLHRFAEIYSKNIPFTFTEAEAILLSRLSRDRDPDSACNHVHWCPYEEGEEGGGEKERQPVQT